MPRLTCGMSEIDILHPVDLGIWLLIINLGFLRVKVEQCICLCFDMLAWSTWYSKREYNNFGNG
jgi:hypothetical protein